MSKNKTKKTQEDSRPGRMSLSVFNRVKAVAAEEDRSVRSVLDQAVPLGLDVRESQKTSK